VLLGITLESRLSFTYGGITLCADAFQLTNTTSFDIPGNEVSQNAEYNSFPEQGTPVLPGTCNASGVGTVSGSFYSCPSGLGIVTHTIGSPRQVQMSLTFNF
jgi:hypothetical protein